MRQLSIFDFLDEAQSQSTAAQAGLLEKQSNISSNITASNTARDEKVANALEEAKNCQLLLQWKNIKSQYPDALLLFRVGDFYEVYNEDAEVASKILGIVKTKRGTSDIPFAGFPFHVLDDYLPKLVREGHRVAICDQIEEPNHKNIIRKSKKNHYKEIK
ncbi:MAG: hypothetical protein ACI30J_08805 [Paludibacteraceae bacterium]